MKRTTLLVAVCVTLVLSPLSARAAVPEPGVTSAQLLKQSRPKAIEVLLKAAQGSDPFVRANAIEAMRYAPERVLPVCELGLHDEQPVVRFAALATIGKLKARSMVRAAEAMTNDPDPSVRAAAYFAASQCGSSMNVTALSRTLFDANPDVSANTAMLLGWMGEPSASQMLIDAGSRPMPRVPDVKVLLLRAQIAEAQVRLGDYEALDVLRGGMFNAFPEVRMLSVVALGELGDVPNVESALFSILRDKDEVLELRLATAAALSQRTGNGSHAVIKEVLDQMPMMMSAAAMGEPAFRAQAAITLGQVEMARARVRPQLLPSDPASVTAMFNDPAPTAALIGLLDDADGRVRVAAAAGVLAAQ